LIEAPLSQEAAMSYVFVSYSQKDRNHARKLADALLNRGFDVWFDAKNG
jgi:hypothetical protein